MTGGGSGIGRGVAQRLARGGATAYVLGRREAMLAETAALADGLPGRVVPVPCDVTRPELVEEAFATVEQDGGPAQALVHSAGSVEYRAARDLTPEAFRTVVESLLLGGFNAIHRWATPLLDGGLPGAAVAITSCIAARGTPQVAHSSSGKAGLEALVRTLAREWGPAGLRLNAVGPGFFPVERTSGIWEDAEIAKPIVDLVALQRLGELDEVVGPIVFLLTEAAGYVTGEVLVTDGGFSLTPQVLPQWRFEPASPEARG